MVRYFWVSLLLFFVAYNKSNAQDLIVTAAGDSIACKIVNQTQHYVHFIYSKSRNNAVRELSNDRIKSIIPGFYNETVLSKNIVMPDTSRIEMQTSTVFGQPDSVSHEPLGKGIGGSDNLRQEKWQLGVNGGYMYRLFRPQINATDYESDYLNELKPGYAIGLEALYFPFEKVGFGLKYELTKTGGERDIRTRDDITIQFAGASVSYRSTFENKKTSIVSSFLFGYQPYHNSARYIGQDFTLKAETMGWGVSVGLSHPISKSFALSVNTSCHMGTVYKFRKELKGRTETIELSNGNHEDLSRVMLTVGLRWLR